MNFNPRRAGVKGACPCGIICSHTSISRAKKAAVKKTARRAARRVLKAVN